jgi:RHS repeat-associated protein
MLGRLAGVAATAIALVVAGLAWPSASRAAPDTAIRYAYDDNGRLKAVTDPGSDTAVYFWDPVGNLLSISRHASSAVKVIQLSPGRGPVGSTVRIAGTGFSSTPSENTVEFNGTSATVQEAGPTELVVAVPAGAATGPVEVTSPGGADTSSDDFTVTDAGPPQISGFSPPVAPAGSPFTITGSHFASDPAFNSLTLNDSRPVVTSASATSIESEVPPDTGSGSLSVTTPDGTDSADFFIPPPGVAASEVDWTGRTEIGATKTVATGSADKMALVVFDGVAGQRVSLEVTANSYADACYSVYKPNNSRLAGVSCISAAGFILGPFTLPRTGSYTVLIDLAGSGSLSFKLHEVPPDVADSFTPTAEGATKTVTTTTPGQKARVTFSGSAGQRISLKAVSAMSNVAEVDLLKPDGSTLFGSHLVAGAETTQFMDTIELPTSGSYTFLVSPGANATGSMTLTAYDVPADATETATPSASGDTQHVTTTTPGQNAKVTFSGSAGQRISLRHIDDYTPYDNPQISLKAPDGADIATTSDSFLDTVTLPSTGTYTITIDPHSLSAGTMTLTIWDVPADATGTVTPSTSGSSASTTTTVPGQNAKINFTGTAGQKILYRVDSETYADLVNVDLRKSDGTWVGGIFNASAGSYSSTLTLPDDGTYNLLINPGGTATGSLSLTVYDVPPDSTTSVTPTAAGAQVTATNTVPGQNTGITVNASAGDRIAYNVTAKGYDEWAYFSIRRPDGTVLEDVGNVTSVPSYKDTVTLPTSGTYTIHIDPDGLATGDVTVTVFAVPPDFTDTLSLSTTGDASTVTTTPGQNAQLTFSGSEGQEASVAITSTSYDGWAYLRLKKPDGSNLLEGWVTDTYTFPTATLPADGTYTISLDPAGKASGTMTVELSEPGEGLRAARNTAAPTDGGQERQRGVPFPFQPDGHALRHDLTLRTARIPGLEVSIPAGAALQDRAGRQLRNLDVRRVRGRDPLPGRANAALRLTFEPTGARLTRSAFVVYPNTPRARPGRRLFLWTLDRPTGTWTIYGRGTVTADGKHVLPDVNARLTALTSTAISLKRPRRPSKAERQAASEPKRATAHQGPAMRKADRAARALKRFKPTGKTTWRPGRSANRGDWSAKRRNTPWTSLPPLTSASTTGLSGQTLKLDGTPLKGVTLSIEGSNSSTRSGRTGRFLLTGLKPGHHVLVVNGRSARTSRDRFGEYEIGADVARGRVTALDFPIWMTALDPAGDKKIGSPSTGETVLRTSRIPGLEIHIPDGSTIRDRDGHHVRKLNLTQVPIDRPPFPLPPFIKIPTYFTVQPGGAYLSKGARIIYPNYNHLPPGQRVDFWQYDPDDLGWHIYGRGSVTPNGKQVVPDRGVRVWELTGAMISGNGGPPGSGPNGGPGCCDPVDLSTGLFVYDQTDLYLPDVLPINLRRTYRPGDPSSYAFGVGTNHPYDLRLWSVNNYLDATLVLPDGGRVFYERISPGTAFEGAVYEAQTTPGRFYKSTLRWNDDDFGWHLRLRDGTVYVFGEFAPLQAIRDRYGNEIKITRSAGQTGNITQVTSPHGRWVKFSYDGSNRITQAVDNGGRTVDYTYDTSGRLHTVTDVKGGETTYTYNGADQMTAIEDARGITYVQNSYDANGRVSEQALANDGVFEFDYTLDANDKVTKTAITDPRGRVDEYVFNSGHYLAGVSRAAGSPLEQVTEYEREAGSNLVSSETDALGRETSYQYDSDGNPTEITRLVGTPDPVTTTLAYEPMFGQPTSITDSLDHETVFDYDGHGQLTQLTDPSGKETEFAYARNDGQPTAITDPADQITQLRYANGDLASVEDPLGRKTTYYHDSLGRLRATTNPLRQRTTLDYDAQNHVTNVTAPEEDETDFEYDANGNLTLVADARSNETEFTYDEMDHVATVTDGLGHEESYSYDETGTLTQHTDRRGKVTTLQPDLLGRLTFAGFGTTGDPGDEDYESTIEYTWDDGDRLLGADDSPGGTYTSTYDDLDRMLSMQGPNGTVEYTYDDAGRRLTMTAPDLPTTSYTYDDANRLTGMTRGADSVSIGHDDAGRRSSVTLPNGIVGSLDWDTASQPTGITYDLGTTEIGDLHYEYDDVGRRTAMWGSLARVGLPDAMASATYDAGNHRTTQGTNTFDYDLDGNLTDDDDTTYAWNARGQLSSLTNGAGTRTFEYDPFGRRTAKSASGHTRGYLHDGPNVVQERMDDVAYANVLAGPTYDDLFARSTPGGTESLLRDALGSTVALTDESGATGTGYTYEPFGETTMSGAPAPEGLVGAWGFDEGSGSSVEDQSEAGNDGSVSGATWSSSGKFGGALSFDGTDDRVVVPDSASLDLDSEMTLEAWVKPDTVGSNWQTVLLKEWNDDYLVYGISTEDAGKPIGAAYMYDDDSLAISQAPDALAEDTWTHLALTYDGSNVKLYVNGSEVASGAATGPIQTTGGDLTIGGTAVFADQWFAGLIDEVRVYDRALSATEIQADEDTAISTIGGGGPSDNPYQFTGRENDGTGLYQYRARYYSPSMKRFISEDPLGLAGGDPNLLSYVRNSPVSYTDPTGLYSVGGDTGGQAPGQPGGGVYTICFHGRGGKGGECSPPPYPYPEPDPCDNPLLGMRRGGGHAARAVMASAPYNPKTDPFSTEFDSDCADGGETPDLPWPDNSPHPPPRPNPQIPRIPVPRIPIPIPLPGIL